MISAQWLQFAAKAKCSSIQAAWVNFKVILCYSRVGFCTICNVTVKTLWHQSCPSLCINGVSIKNTSDSIFPCSLILVIPEHWVNLYAANFNNVYLYVTYFKLENTAILRLVHFSVTTDLFACNNSPSLYNLHLWCITILTLSSRP